MVCFQIGKPTNLSSMEVPGSYGELSRKKVFHKGLLKGEPWLTVNSSFPHYCKGQNHFVPKWHNMAELVFLLLPARSQLLVSRDSHQLLGESTA